MLVIFWISIQMYPDLNGINSKVDKIAGMFLQKNGL
jgi:hypothetical protein